MSEETQSGNRYRLCPKCGNFSHVLEEQFYCILCGTKLTERCSQCGTSILHPLGKFCHHCGAGYRTAVAGTDQS